MAEISCVSEIYTKITFLSALHVQFEHFHRYWGQQSSFKHLHYSALSIFMYQGDKHVKHRLYKHGRSQSHEAV